MSEKHITKNFPHKVMGYIPHLLRMQEIAYMKAKFISGISI